MITLAHGTDLWQLVVSGPLRVKTADKLKERLVAVARQSAEDAYLTAELRKAGTKPDDVFRPLVNDVKLRAEMWICFQCNKSGNGQEPTGCRRAF